MVPLIMEEFKAESRTAQSLNQHLTSNKSVVNVFLPEEHDHRSTGEATIVSNHADKIAQPKCYWDIIPFEIREQIFTDYFESDRHWSWEEPRFDGIGKVPAIVEGLRRLPVAYSHALQWFARTATILLSGSPWGTSLFLSDLDFNETELAAVQRVCIDLTAIVYYTTLAHTNGNPEIEYRFKKPTVFTQQFTKMPNLREVYLYLDLDDTDQAHMAIFLTEFPFWLQGCKKVSAVTVELPTWSMNERERNMVHGIVEGIYKKTGVQGQLVKTTEIRNNKVHEEAEIWVWEARKGEFMDWSQELGREFKGPRPYHSEPRELKDFWYEDLHTRLEFDENAGSFSLDGWHCCWPHVGESCLVEEEASRLRSQGHIL